MSRLEILEGALEGLIDESDALLREKKRLHRKMCEVSDRLLELHGGLSRYGEIERARDKVAKKKREIEDEGKPSVLWTDGTTSEETIIRKVTKKRIYVSERGKTCSTQYVRATGEQVSKWSSSKTIDIKAMGITPEEE
jgi:predicted nuclease with TOPRIM domain